MTELDDPYSLLGAAARGDIEAQRSLARLSVEFSACDDVDAVHALTEGLVFARMAAAQGTLGDQGLVVSMLGLLMERSSGDPASDWVAEALARVEICADAGCAVADEWGLTMMKDATPEVSEAARDIYARMKRGLK